MNLAVLPYFAVIWAFTNYVGVIATPWTIGWIMLWLLYSPIVTWGGIPILGGAPRLAAVCCAGLVLATPFWPDATWMLVTMFVSAVLGTAVHLWIALTLFASIVTGIHVWYHGGIVL